MCYTFNNRSGPLVQPFAPVEVQYSEKHENKSYEIHLNITNLPAFLKSFQQKADYFMSSTDKRQ